MGGGSVERRQPGRAAADDEKLWWDGVARVDALVVAGWSIDAISRRVKTGRWQRPVRGVVCRFSGTLTDEQRRIVGLLYGGETAVLSHQSAGSIWDLNPEPQQIHVTTRHGLHVASNRLVRVHQSGREVDPRFVEDLPLTPPARTAIDVALDGRRLDNVRALLGRAVQRGLASPQQLLDELALAPKRGSLLPRLALEGITVGARSAPEGRLVRLVRRGRLPMPELNAPVQTADGTRFVDGLWRKLRKGVEIDGRPYHFDPAAWAAGLVRQNAIQATGIMLLRFPAYRLWRDEDAVLAELVAFLSL